MDRPRRNQVAPVCSCTNCSGAHVPRRAAAGREALRALWARDPWHESHLILESVEPWQIRLATHELHLR
jgi:hypothetical protein